MADMCTGNRFELIEKFKKELIESTNIETSPEEMKVIDNILFRFWQMGWLDSIDRMPLVKESAKTLIHSAGVSVSAKSFRNAGRFIQNAIDGETPDFEQIPTAQPEVIRCKDCKHWERTWTNSWSPNYHYCPMIDRSCPSDFYCADAERRTDERPD